MTRARSDDPIAAPVWSTSRVGRRPGRTRLAVLVATTLASLLAGAGAGAFGGAAAYGTPQPRSQPPAGRADALAAATGHVVVVGSAQFPPTLDPTANAAQAIDEVVDYNVLQHLVQLAPDGKIVPMLASSYTLSRNRKVYTFAVRQGVEFSNGDLLTPADVVFSIRRVLTDKSYPYAKVFDVASARVVSGGKVAVTLVSPSWSFLFDLAAYSNGVILDPRTVGKLATDPIGTGPYVVKGDVPNYSVSLGVNRHYFAGPLANAGVTFRYFSDPNAENAALESGQIDVIDNLSTPSELSVFTSRPRRYVVVSGLTNGKVQLTINNAASPFRSKLVRQALEYAIDKKTVIDVAAAGHSIAIGTDSVPSDPYYLDLSTLYPYDPRKAKALLNQAGYPNGFSTTLTLPPYYYAQLAGPVIQQELAAVGIDVTIQQVAFPLWLSQVFEGGNFDLTIIDHAEARDVGNYGTTGYYWHYANTPKVAAALAAANAAPTQQQWIRKTRGVLRQIAGDAVNVWLYALPALSVHRVGVVGLPTFGYTESFDLSHASFAGSIPRSLTSLGYSAR